MMKIQSWVNLFEWIANIENIFSDYFNVIHGEETEITDDDIVRYIGFQYLIVLLHIAHARV